MNAQNDGGPAFPVECSWSGDKPHGLQTGPASGWETGLSVRDWFATHAPTDVPPWFRLENAPQVPRLIGAEDALKIAPGYDTLTKDDRRKVLDWLCDPCWEVDDEVSPEVASIAHCAMDSINAARAAHDAAIVEIEVMRLIAWRWHYADLMIRARAKS